MDSLAAVWSEEEEEVRLQGREEVILQAPTSEAGVRAPPVKTRKARPKSHYCNFLIECVKMC